MFKIKNMFTEKPFLEMWEKWLEVDFQFKLLNVELT